jgi:hypothetical protein
VACEVIGVIRATDLELISPAIFVRQQIRAKRTKKLDLARHKFRNTALCLFPTLFVSAVANEARSYDSLHSRIAVSTTNDKIAGLKAELREPPRGLIENVVVDRGTVHIKMRKRSELPQDRFESGYLPFGICVGSANCSKPETQFAIMVKFLVGVLPLFSQKTFASMRT